MTVLASGIFFFCRNAAKNLIFVFRFEMERIDTFILFLFFLGFSLKVICYIIPFESNTARMFALRGTCQSNQTNGFICISFRQISVDFNRVPSNPQSSTCSVPCRSPSSGTDDSVEIVAIHSKLSDIAYDSNCVR